MAEQSGRPQARSGMLALAFAGLLGLAVSGCTFVPASEPPPRTPVATAPAPPPPPSRVPALPPDETRNRVAVLVPLSGPNGGVGTSIANAANLALLDTGAERIRITVYDTAKAGPGAAVNEAIAQGSGLILGPLLAEEVRAVAPVARRAGVPVIAFSNDISVAGSGVYVMGFSPSQSVQRVVRHARSKGAQRFAALIPAGVYGQRASRAMIDAVEESGGRMVAMQDFDRSPAGLRDAIGRLNAQGGYDAVLIADSGRIAAVAAPIIKAGASRAARILGTELWGTEGNLGQTPAMRGAWFAAPSDTMFNQLRTRYRARYNRVPYRLASLGYDSVLLAMRVGANWRVGARFPDMELTNPDGFAGIDGAFRFGSDGIAERMLDVQEVTAGGTIVVSPAAKAFPR